MSEAHMGRPVSVETRQRISKNHNSKPHRAQYNGMWFRSSWEAKYAEYLDKAKVRWLYEPHVFTLTIDNKETTYRPDFYLPEFGVYHEVKGYKRRDYDPYAKVLAAREQHNLNVIVVDYKLLRRLRVL